jgi:hypothetical protein
LENAGSALYVAAMSDHSLSEAQARLPELAARAKAGEDIVIAMEDGVRLVLHRVEAEEPLEIPPVPEGNGPELLAWLDRIRVGRVAPSSLDAAQLLRRMRDEDD